MRFVLTLSLVSGVAGFARSDDSQVIIQGPAAKEVVAKVDEVKGIWTVDGSVPIVFCKPLNGGEWYAQAKCTVDGAKFKCNAHFGDEDTKPGTGFKIVVVAVLAKDAANYKEGVKVAALPAGTASKSVTVTR